MTIKHKNSDTEISEFPHYYKTDFGYGYIIVTFDLKILFIYHLGDNIDYEDISDSFEIITK